MIGAQRLTLARARQRITWSVQRGAEEMSMLYRYRCQTCGLTNVDYGQAAQHQCATGKWEEFIMEPVSTAEGVRELNRLLIHDRAKAGLPLTKNMPRWEARDGEVAFIKPGLLRKLAKVLK